jgi:hypothetical protein
MGLTSAKPSSANASGKASAKTPSGGQHISLTDSLMRHIDMAKTVFARKPLCKQGDSA